MQNISLLTSGRLALKVTPGAREEGVGALLVDAGGVSVLHVKVRAGVEDGKANKALIALISEAFDIPRSGLSVLRGGASRHKMIAYRAG